MRALANLDAITMQQHRSDSSTDPATQAASDPSANVDSNCAQDGNLVRTSAWVQLPPTSLICLARTKPVHKPVAKKRAGAKAVKKMERLESQGYKLTPTDATTFCSPFSTL